MSDVGPGVQMEQTGPSEAAEPATEPVAAADPGWTPPWAAVDSGGGPWGYGPQGPSAGEAPAPQRRPGRKGMAVIAVLAMVLASGGVGVAIGAGLHRGTSRASVFPPAPSSSTGSSGQATLPTVGGAAPSGGDSAGGGLDAAAIAAKVDPAVVNITTRLADGEAAGTGMVLTSSGLVLTNNHVIEGATQIQAQIDGTGPTYRATVLGYDVTDDVALLQLVNASGLKTVSVGDSSKVAVDDPVVAIGNALGRGGTPTATQGAVAALNQSITANDTTGNAETLDGMIEINAPIQPGDSGGALVNAAGQVIGMNTAASGGYRRFSTSRVAFAIPINTALSLARQIQAGQASAKVHVGPRAILGVEVQGATEGGGFGQPFGPDSGTGSAGAGAPVVAVETGSPAESAGLAAGDVIVAVGGKTVTSASDLRSDLDSAHPGDRISVTWTDPSGQRHSADVQLVAGPPA